VLPFTLRYAVDNLFKRRHRPCRGATNLNKINYQTVTLTYRLGEGGRRVVDDGRWSMVGGIKEQVVKA